MSIPIVCTYICSFEFFRSSGASENAKIQSLRSSRKILALFLLVLLSFISSPRYGRVNPLRVSSFEAPAVPRLSVRPSAQRSPSILFSRHCQFPPLTRDARSRMASEATAFIPNTARSRVFVAPDQEYITLSFPSGYLPTRAPRCHREATESEGADSQTGSSGWE